jgi:transcriptional regulator with XRE-family HTH domain
MAHAMTDFGAELRRLLAERGMSLNELARRSNYDPGYLSKVGSGQKRATAAVAARLDDVLGAGGSLSALADDGPLFNGGLSPDRRERIEWARQHPGRPDAAVAESLAVVLDAQRHAEDALGSAAVMRAVLAQLDVTEDLVREARGPARPALVHVAGQWAQFAGWLQASTGHHDKASARLSQALQWAVEAGEVNLISEVLSFQGHAAYIAGHPGPVIGLSQAAQRDRSAYPGQLAISAAQEAKGHAMEGRGADADRLLDEADELAARARERRAEAPPWLYYHTDGFFDLQRGEAYGYLADDPLYHSRAAAALASGHAALPASAQRSEWGAEYLMHLAAVHARGGDLEQAYAVAMQAAGIARSIGSNRLSRMLKRLRARLAARWPDDARVAELAEAIR